MYNKNSNFFLKILCIQSVLCLTYGNYIDNYYCGNENCYDVLQVTRDTTKPDIKRAFRALASKTHPDKFLNHDDKKIAEAKFLKLQTAYDILRDDEVRSDYNYMLDNPDEFYMNVYRAWRRRHAPNVDVRIVIAVSISLISLIQYFNGWQKYEEAIKYFTTVPKYRLHAQELAKQEGLLTAKKKIKGISKEEIKQREEKIIRQIIESKMDIRGVYAKPTYKDVLWIQLFLAPVWIFNYVRWYVSWIWKFDVKKQKFGREEHLYLIRKNMKMSQGQFDALEDHVIEEYQQLHLYEREKFNTWKEDRDSEVRSKLAQSGKYKAYRRYMKSNGPGRIYFDDS